MTALACGQPGCTGTMADGYCDACGLASAPSVLTGQVSSAGQAESAAAAVLTSQSGAFTAATSARVGGSSQVSRPTGSGTGRGRLGAGLVDIPPVQPSDPASVVLSDPRVQESRRFCSSCEQPVGRGIEGVPGRSEGFCKNCGAKFSFQPKLQPGHVVAGQYEVLGCLAHGGLGWIYLAKDRNVSDRWVVLKGLLNSGDADAQAAAVAERRFLAEVEHPNIVRIYNFVEHPDSQTGEPTGYIVMEYVGGQSLRQIVLERRAAGQSLPVAQALAYAIEILPALGYLHRLGLIYCDFKPDNVIQVEEQLKLIDLGGVRRADDDDSPIYGTVGYQAPEIETAGPSPSSDLYTVGRALAVLTFEFAGSTGDYRHRLPDPATVPVLAQHESFYRLLCRATSSDLRRRFSSAAEMTEQATGVLREVLAAEDGQPRPAFSSRFTPDLHPVGARTDNGPAGPATAEIAAALPVPLADSADPAAGYVATLSTLGPQQLAEELRKAIAEQGAASGVASGAEAYLALTRTYIALGDVVGARWSLAQLAGRGLADWRATWYEGLAQLLSGDLAAARDAFDAVYDVLPGELAPKLALGLVAEAAGETPTAARYFRAVWTTDRSYVSAAFGLARVLLAGGDTSAAVTVLGSVPEASTYHLAAQIGAVRARLSVDPAALEAADLTDAAGRLEKLALDAVTRQTLTAQVLQAGLTLIKTKATTVGGLLLDCELTDKSLRLGLERSYRALARQAATRNDRIALVDLANDVRPRTLA
jgi:serine/threonine-protein kinase PknG